MTLVREGLDQGVARAVHRHRGGDRSGDRSRRSWPRWARSAWPWASMPATVGSRSAGGPRHPTTTRRGRSRAAWSGEGVAHGHLHRHRARRHAHRPRPRRRAPAAGRRASASSRAAASPGAATSAPRCEAGLAGAIVGRALYEGRLTPGGGARGCRGRRRDDPSRARRPGARGRPGGIHLSPASSGPAAAAGCRSPAGRWPGPRSASCCST